MYIRSCHRCIREFSSDSATIHPDRVTDITDALKASVSKALNAANDLTYFEQEDPSRYIQIFVKLLVIFLLRYITTQIVFE